MFPKIILENFKKYNFDTNENLYEIYNVNFSKLEKFYSKVDPFYIELITQEIENVLNSDLVADNLHWLNIMRKVAHSLVEVPLISLDVYENSTNKENRNEKFTAVLLHDIGHFKQYMITKKFRDNEVKHGEIGSQILLDTINQAPDKNMVTSYAKAITEHSLVKVEATNPMVYELIYFIRDCDKLAMFLSWERHQKGVFLENRNNLNLLEESYSDNVLSTFKNHKAIDYKYLKTKSDYLISLIAYTFDYYDDSCIKIMKDQKLLEPILELLKSQLKNEKQFLEINSIINKYINNLLVFKN